VAVETVTLEVAAIVRCHAVVDGSDDGKYVDAVETAAVEVEEEGYKQQEAEEEESYFVRQEKHGHSLAYSGWTEADKVEEECCCWMLQLDFP
jgi:hypothetical protein